MIACGSNCFNTERLGEGISFSSYREFIYCCIIAVKINNTHQLPPLHHTTNFQHYTTPTTTTTTPPPPKTTYEPPPLHHTATTPTSGTTTPHHHYINFRHQHTTSPASILVTFSITITAAAVTHTLQ
ncbi:hypothetical protein Pmani_029958 [Petrolisthes manimaculis]|uniref:Uncharacterized protein n=1 Tax=Petrolisthes manimaculis TaxID=1843537 RepID=A0AAE1NWM2_9EUCA|nr:hypothetical protein Pmani_029958 [Petrolisthes manimaculis]